jgi:hypothetical protein
MWDILQLQMGIPPNWPAQVFPAPGWGQRVNRQSLRGVCATCRFAEPAAKLRKGASFAFLLAALAVGAFVIVGAMPKSRRLPTGP